MGWILTSKKKKADEEKAAEAAAAQAAAQAPVAASKQVHWNPQLTLMKVRIGAGLAGAVALGFGWVWMTGALERYAADRLDRVDTPVAEVELSNAPAWMGSKLREQLQGVAGQKISNDPMAAKELSMAYVEFSNNPWVESVKSVRRTANGGIVIEATYREPVAMIEQAEGLRIVDAKGVMLPGVYTRQEQESLRLPVICGVTGAQPEADGGGWNTPDVMAGLATMKALRRETYFNQVVRYDVGRRDKEGRVRVLLVTPERQIDWGFPAGQEQALEQGVEHKLKLVSSLFKGDQKVLKGRIANVYGDELTSAPMLVNSREEARIEYTRTR